MSIFGYLRQPEITSDQFEEMSLYDKGYAVYMFGERIDQPNIPSSYDSDSKEYAAGMHQAYIDILDIEG